MVRLSQAFSKWIDFPLNHPTINVICFLKLFFLQLWCHSKDALGIWGQTQKPRLMPSPLSHYRHRISTVSNALETVVAIPFAWYFLPVASLLALFCLLGTGDQTKGLKHERQALYHWAADMTSQPLPMSSPYVRSWLCYLDTRRFFWIKLEIPSTAQLIQFCTAKVRL